MRREESPSVLTGGRWVARGGVQRWEPLPPVSSLVVCPTCLATIAEPCRTKNGYAADHPERLMSVRCPCGAVPTPGSAYCTTECRNDYSREAGAA